MSSVWYQFISRSQTATCKSRSCDWCGLTLERLKAPPTSENDREGVIEWPKGSFVGWSSYSRVLGVDAEGNPRDLRIDFCKGCTDTLWDGFLHMGLDEKIVEKALAGHQTVYLDARGRVVKKEEVEGRPACVWKSEGRLGIRPCRRLEGHEGDCSGSYEQGWIDCAVCLDADQVWTYTTGPKPVLFTESGLENHMMVEHGATFEDGEWHVRLAGAQAHHPSIHGAMQLLADMHAAGW